MTVEILKEAFSVRETPDFSQAGLEAPVCLTARTGGALELLAQAGWTVA